MHHKTVKAFETFCKRVVVSGDVPSIKELLLLCHVVKRHGWKGTLSPGTRQMFIVGGFNLEQRLPSHSLPEAFAVICSSTEPELRVVDAIRSIDREIDWVIRHVSDLGLGGVHVDPAVFQEAQDGEPTSLPDTPWPRVHRPSEVPAASSLH